MECKTDEADRRIAELTEKFRAQLEEWIGRGRSPGTEAIGELEQEIRAKLQQIGREALETVVAVQELENKSSHTESDCSGFISKGYFDVQRRTVLQIVASSVRLRVTHDQIRASARPK